MKNSSILNKRLLFVTPCLSFAGAEKILCWVAGEFAKTEYEVHILNLNLISNNSDFRIRLTDKIIVHTLDSTFKKGLNNYYRLKSIIDIAKNNKINLMISFTQYPCVLTSLAGLISGIPVLISERGDPLQFSKGFRNKINFCILNSAKGCVFQTEYAKVVYSRKLIERSIVIPNPVFRITEQRWEYHNTKVIVSIGRLENIQKRYDLMLDAFENFSIKHDDYILNIFGKGPDEEYLKSIVENKSIGNKVYFKGITNNATSELLSADIFLITSDYEGVPNALLEAMAIGMPVISTDCSPGGAKFLIKDHQNGLLVSRGDAQSISKALDEYVNNLSLMNKCATNAGNITDLFSPEKVFIMWKNYIDKILK